MLSAMQNAQCLVNAEDGRDAGEHIDVEGDLTMLPHHLHPVLIGRPRGQPKNEAALLLGQPPKIGDGQKCAQARCAQPAPIGWGEALSVQARRPGLNLSSCFNGNSRHG